MLQSASTKKQNIFPKQRKAKKNVSCLSDSTSEGDTGAPLSASRTQGFQRKQYVTRENVDPTMSFPKKSENPSSPGVPGSSCSGSKPPHDQLERAWQRLFKESCLALNYLADLVFHHDLNNAVKLVNACVATILGLNTYSLYLELEYNGFEWTTRGYWLAGFLILAMGLLFLLNAVMAALPREALLKIKGSSTKKSLSAKISQSRSESPSQKVASRKSVKRKHRHC